MTPAASILEPNSNPSLYVAAVLTLYVDLPDTPLRASVPDQRQARIWFDRGVPLEVVETALLLACLRRTARPSTVSNGLLSHFCVRRSSGRQIPKIPI